MKLSVYHGTYTCTMLSRGYDYAPWYNGTLWHTIGTVRTMVRQVVFEVLQYTFTYHGICTYHGTYRGTMVRTYVSPLHLTRVRTYVLIMLCHNFLIGKGHTVHVYVHVYVLKMICHNMYTCTRSLPWYTY
jgi:hypothetical protein